MCLTLDTSRATSSSSPQKNEGHFQLVLPASFKNTANPAGVNAHCGPQVNITVAGGIVDELLVIEGERAAGPSARAGLEVGESALSRLAGALCSCDTGVRGGDRQAHESDEQAAGESRTIPGRQIPAAPACC